LQYVLQRGRRAEGTQVNPFAPQSKPAPVAGFFLLRDFLLQAARSNLYNRNRWASSTQYPCAFSSISGSKSAWILRNAFQNSIAKHVMHSSLRAA
jgi:hypothetical protein